jgi:uncharacterized protein
MTAGKGPYGRLVAAVGSIGPCAVAFSGGADSTLLLRAARKALGGNLLALTVCFPYTLSRDLETAKRLALDLGVRHRVLRLPPADGMGRNPENRCYLCKRRMMEAIADAARSEGLATVIEGTNRDDGKTDRPGLKALEELGIRSPLRECALGKAEVKRSLSRTGGIGGIRQSDSCLLTRFPFHTEIDPGKFERIEAAEDLLLDLGFRDVRVRDRGDFTVIEVRRADRHRFFRGKTSDSVIKGLKALELGRIAVDLRGYGVEEGSS